MTFILARGVLPREHNPIAARRLRLREGLASSIKGFNRDDLKSLNEFDP